MFFNMKNNKQDRIFYVKKQDFLMLKLKKVVIYENTISLEARFLNDLLKSKAVMNLSRGVIEISCSFILILEAKAGR